MDSRAKRGLSAEVRRSDGPDGPDDSDESAESDELDESAERAERMLSTFELAVTGESRAAEQLDAAMPRQPQTPW